MEVLQRLIVDIYKQGCSFLEDRPNKYKMIKYKFQYSRLELDCIRTTSMVDGV